MEALGSFLASRSGIREVLEGFGNEVGKRDVPGGAAGVPAPEAHGGGVHNGRKVWPWGGQQEGQKTRSHPPRLLTPKGSADLVFSGGGVEFSEAAGTLRG